jgi:hypothetical protein
LAPLTIQKPEENEDLDPVLVIEEPVLTPEATLDSFHVEKAKPSTETLKETKKEMLNEKPKKMPSMISYGGGNISPVNDDLYMKSFNAKLPSSQVKIF